MAVALAWLSHPIADALSIDTSVPYGVMALWPLSSGMIYSGWDVFGPISRRYWLDGFWYINLTSLVREVAILLPLAMLVWWGRRNRT